MAVGFHTYGLDSDKDTPRFYAKIDQEIHMVTTGLFYFKEELARKNDDRSDIPKVTLEAVINGLNERYGKEHACYHFKTDDATHSRALERRIKEEYPVYKDCTVILVNCLDQDDPAHDPECHGHIGRHPETMRQVAEQTKGEVVRRMINGLGSWRQDLVQNPRLHGDGNALIVFICRKRRHRSVAGRHLTHEAKDCFEQYFGTQMAPISRDVTWHHCSKG